MKIAITGYSGSGKSTLARWLGEKYGAEVLHLDTVNFMPNWVERTTEEKQEMVRAFMDTHDSWVIEGNYSRCDYDRRMEEADIIIQMRFNRFSSFIRARKRYHTYKGTSRPDMAQGCNEKFDLAFAKWILYEGRSRTARDRYRQVEAKYPDKTVVLKNQRQIDAYKRSLR